MQKQQGFFDNDWRVNLKHYQKTREFQKLLSFWKKTLILPEKKLDHLVFVMFVGPQGFGKTTLAELLQQEFIPAVHLKTDAIYSRAEGYQGLEHTSDYYRAYAIQEALAAEYLSRGFSVIMDDNYRTAKNRFVLYQLAAQHNARIILFGLRKLHLEAAAKRVLRREHLRGKERTVEEVLHEIQMFKNHTKYPSEEEIHVNNILYREINISQSVDAIHEELKADKEFMAAIQ